MSHTEQEKNMSSTEKHKILIATGGTGGHLFPAQALARALIQKGGHDVLFAGKGLGSNRCFHKDEFPYHEISSAPINTSDLKKFSVSSIAIAKGLFQSTALIHRFDPDLVIGFGSFYSFPLLCAATFRKIPFVLFEPNAKAGKVNRLFSRWAKATAIQFAGVANSLKGKIFEVSVPLWEKEERKSMTEEEARSYFCLAPSKLTILVFGGSQGASSINQLFAISSQRLFHANFDFQVIHIAGDAHQAEKLRRFYEKEGIPACVKSFEDRMNLAWRAASIVICRAGAASLAEQIAFEVPGILIPFPYAADDHQKKNAHFMQDVVGGAICLTENYLTPELLLQHIRELIDPERNLIDIMKRAISEFKTKENKKDLIQIVEQILNI